jgi:hypothetical protein
MSREEMRVIIQQMNSTKSRTETEVRRKVINIRKQISVISLLMQVRPSVNRRMIEELTTIKDFKDVFLSYLLYFSGI